MFWGTLVFIGTVWLSGFSAWKHIILRPEVEAADAKITSRVELAGVKLDEIQRVQIEQLKVNKAVKQRQLRYEKDPIIRRDIELDIRDLEKQIENAERMRQIK